ncbi:hypothetical protein ABIB90_006203 [Bradyrhizobium sp. JR4.1]|uniref:hypothetical protein n=1 Tax=Bradyrhizobium sp. JR4.1 TaxID=3156372 RepID=UPI003397B598
MLARMSSVFGALFDRAQNASIHRLHEAQRSGQINTSFFPISANLNLPTPKAGRLF